MLRGKWASRVACPPTHRRAAPPCGAHLWIEARALPVGTVGGVALRPAPACALVRLAMLRTCVVAWLLGAAAALEPKWTPNGDAPAPYSTRARQQMGMDPGAMAGAPQASGKPLVPAKSAAPFAFGALLIIYICNNWKVVEALQALVLQLIEPFLAASRAKQTADAQTAKEGAAVAARKARLARLDKDK